MGILFDRLAQSPAWQRLQERSPSDADRFVVNLKHDLINVLMAVVAASDESLTSTQNLKNEIDKLKRDLFEPDDGDFAKVRRYVDSKYARWSNLAATVAGGVIVAVVAYFVSQR